MSDVTLDPHIGTAIITDWLQNGPNVNLTLNEDKTKRVTAASVMRAGGGSRSGFKVLGALIGHEDTEAKETLRRAEELT